MSIFLIISVLIVAFFVIKKLIKSNQALNYYNRGVEKRQLGNFPEALENYNQAIHLNPNYASAYNNRGNIYLRLEQPQKALNDFNKYVSINPRAADAYYNRGLAYSDLDYPEEAIANYNQAIYLAPNYANAYYNRGLIYLQSGNIQQAIADSEQVLRLNPNDADAENLYIQAIETLAKNIENNRSSYNLDDAGYLNNLAQSYHSMGRYAEAESLYRQALDIFARLSGTDDYNYAGCLSNLAWLYRTMGRYSEAEPFYIKALETTAKFYGTQDSRYATSLNNLAQSYYSMGRYAEAEPLYLQALNIIANTQGTNHPHYAISLDNLALLYHSMVRDIEAEQLYREALNIKAELYGTTHPLYAVSLNNLAHSYVFMGRYRDAELLYLQVLDIFANTLGTDHPDYATYLENLASLYAATDRSQDSLALMQASANIDLKTISQIFSISTDNQRLNYLQQSYIKLECFLSLVFQHFSNTPEVVQSAYNLVLQRKAIATESTILQKIALLSEQYSHLVPKLEQWRQVRQKLAQRCFDIPNPEELSHYHNEIDFFTQQAEMLERELNIPEINLHKELQNADYLTIARELPEGTTLVEFIRFNVVNFKAISASGDSKLFPPRYIAFILPAKEPERLQMVDLGEAELIDSLVREFRESVEIARGFDLDEITEAGEIDPKIQLRLLVFDKLKPYISKNLFICPDGELNCLPFEALPTEPEGYLIDEYNFNFLSVGRDILRFKTQIPAKVSKPVVIANPDYNLAAEGNNNSSSQTAERSIYYQKLAASRSGQMFLPLPGTEIEAEKIAKLLGVKPHIQARALKSLVSKTKTSPYILHIATHGCFLKEIQPMKEENIWQNFLLSSNTQSKRLLLAGSQNPLLCSVLLLLEQIQCLREKHYQQKLKTDY